MVVVPSNACVSAAVAHNRLPQGLLGSGCGKLSQPCAICSTHRISSIFWIWRVIEASYLAGAGREAGQANNLPCHVPDANGLPNAIERRLFRHVRDGMPGNSQLVLSDSSNPADEVTACLPHEARTTDGGCRMRKTAASIAP